MAEPKPITIEELEEDVTVPKILHSGDDWVGQPYVLAHENGVEISAGKSERHDKGIHVTSEFGTQITGPMSFSEMPQHLSFGCGYWRLNPMHLACIGSQAALPVPVLVYDTPNLIKAKNDMKKIGTGVGV